MKKKVFIVDPSRDSALAFAAAIKHEDLSPQVFEDDGGFYAAIDDSPPDLVILRAEGTKSSGYAICNRLKGTPKTAAIKTIIITLRGDDQMAVHKKSQLKSDAYVAPPLGLKELRIDALALLGIEGALVDDGAVDSVEEDPFAQLDKALEEKEQSKPEAPVDLTEEEKKANAAAEAKAEADKKASHNFSDDDIDGAFGILGDGPKAQAKPEEKPAEESDEPELIEDDDFLEVPEAPKMVSPLQDMSEEDLAFVNNSFQQNVDRGAPPLPPGITRKEDLTGPDAKIYQLREALREKEQELYRLQQIWEQHDKAFAESAQHVLEKDVEVTQLRMQVDELKANLARRNEDDKRKEREFSASADRLIEEKVLLEKDLIEVVAAKEKIAHEQRRMLAARERDIEELRTKSEHDRMTLEAERNQAAAAYEQQLAEMRGEIARIVAEANAAAEAARNESDRVAVDHSNALAARDRATQDLEAKLLKEMDDQRATAEGLLSETRSVFEGQIAELRQKAEEQIAALNQKVEGLLGQLGDSDAKLQSTSAELSAAREKINEREATIESKGSGLQRVANELSDVKQQLTTKEGELTEARQLLREDERDLTQTSEVARLTERLTQSEASLSQARQGHEGDAAQLQGQLDAKARANESLQAELGSLRERLAMLESTSQERTATLLQELDVARTANKEMALKLEQRLGQKDQIIAQKDEMLAQLSKEVGTGREEREGLVQRLSERLKEREATIAKRDDEVLFARGALSQQEKAFEARMKELDAARTELEKQHAATAARLSEVQKQAGEKLEAQMLELEQIKQALKLANERLAAPATAAPPPAVTINTPGLPPINSAPAAALAAALGMPAAAPRPASGFPVPPPPAAAPGAPSPEEDSLLDDVGKKLGI